MTAGRLPDDADGGPLTAADAAPLFATSFAEATGVLLAVSGGPDSIALMHLAAALTSRSVPLAVASVDHGLRDGSRRVADGVVAAAAALGLPARVLAWSGPKPSTRLQEAARDARYALLLAEARRIGASHLATAHTLDDQAETVLFRLIRGSGLEGLAGMRPARDRQGVVHMRPLLGIPKSRLVATCRARGWTFEIDPANADPRFARTRLRRLVPLLAEEGFDAAGLARLGRRLGDADDAILEAARGVLSEATIACAVYRAAPILGAPKAVRRRALGLLLADRARSGPPRLERLERLVDELTSAATDGVKLRRTLHGVLLTFDGCDRLSLAPEPARHASKRSIENHD